MEIILLLMALGATPFGAAMLDKHTRNRFKKYAKAHIKVVPHRLTMAEALKIEPRNKDWKADTALAQLWLDAFDWLSIPDRDKVLTTYRQKHATYINKHQELTEKYNKYKEIYRLYIDTSNSGFTAYDAVDADSLASNVSDELHRMEKAFKMELTSTEKAAQRISDRYGSEVHYNNDLIRLTAQQKMPTFDYLALTAYTSK